LFWGGARPDVVWANMSLGKPLRHFSDTTECGIRPARAKGPLGEARVFKDAKLKVRSRL
jgi:hypothetical protein